MDRSNWFHRSAIALCVAVFVLQSGPGGARFTSRFALYGPAIAEGEWWRLLTSGFLHANLLHLGFNMLMLYFFARVLESRLARSSWQFPLLYVVSLLGGSLGALLLEYSMPALGASGAVFGLGGAMLLRDRFELGNWNASGTVSWIAINLVFTLALPGISKGGHLGGLAAGAAFGWVLFARSSTNRR
jgi:membrane associated rhomboid family serine protease